MLRRPRSVAAVLIIGLTSACLSPVPREDWPVKDDPLFRSAVWIEPPGKYGSGVIVHSSERGTYVLTVAHVISDDDGYRLPDGVVEVGVYAISHASPVGEPYVMYAADVVATTAPRATAGGDPVEGLLSQIRWLSWVDLAILRLRTDRRFLAAPLFTGSPDAMDDRPAVLVPVVPEMYPHRKPATCDPDTVRCPDIEHGNSGAPVFVDGEVVGVGSAVSHGPGPKMLQDFLREHEETRFLLAEPEASSVGRPYAPVRAAPSRPLR